MRIVQVPIDKIMGINTPIESRVDALVSSMTTNGWIGRPLLAIATYGGRIQALTGSNRIRAARRAGMSSVPARLIGRRRVAIVERQFDMPQGQLAHELLHCSGDTERYNRLRHYGLVSASSCLNREMSANIRSSPEGLA